MADTKIPHFLWSWRVHDHLSKSKMSTQVTCKWPPWPDSRSSHPRGHSFLSSTPAQCQKPIHRGERRGWDVVRSPQERLSGFECQGWRLTKFTPEFKGLDVLHCSSIWQTKKRQCKKTKREGEDLKWSALPFLPLQPTGHATPEVVASLCNHFPGKGKARKELSIWTLPKNASSTH